MPDLTTPPPPAHDPAFVDRIAQAIVNPGSIVGKRIHIAYGDDHVETVSSWGTRAVLAVLDQAGLPLGEPTEVNAEYSVWWHGAGDGIRMSQHHIGTLAQAREVGPTRFGAYGITRFTVHRREHRRYANGATLIGPWREVPDGDGEPAPDVPAGGRGECRS